MQKAKAESFGMDEDVVVVLELVKAWVSENTAALLAKEDQIVFWGTASAVLDDKKSWVTWSLKECVQILKATVIPFGLMKHCTQDLVRAACTELERSFISGVTSMKPVSPLYFNFYVGTEKLHGIEYNVEADLIQRIIHHLERMRVNVQIVDIGNIYEYAASLLDRPTLTANARNKFMRQAIIGTEYVEKNYTQRYWFDGVSYSCLRYGKEIGMLTFTPDELHAMSMDILRESSFARKFAVGEFRKALNV